MESEIIGDAKRWDDERGDLEYTWQAETLTSPQVRIAELERELAECRIQNASYSMTCSDLMKLLSNAREALAVSQHDVQIRNEWLEQARKWARAWKARAKYERKEVARWYAYVKLYQAQ